MKRRDRAKPRATSEEQLRAQLLEQAKQLAQIAFTRPGRGHVLAVYERLAWNRLRGLGETGAATVH